MRRGWLLVVLGGCAFQPGGLMSEPQTPGADAGIHGHADGGVCPTPCPLGCVDGHCAVMQPSNGVDPGWLAGATAEPSMPRGSVGGFHPYSGELHGRDGATAGAP